MSLSLAGIGLVAAAGLAVGALAVRPIVFAYSVPDGRRSGCPHCGLPVVVGLAGTVSRVLIRPRCPHGAAGEDNGERGPRIGPLPGLPEALTGGGAAAVAWAGGPGWLLAMQLWMVMVGAALLLVDLAVTRLPDHLSAAAAVGVAVLLVIASVMDSRWQAFGRAALAALVVGVVFVVLALLGMGLGDVKLAPTLAAVLGWHSWTAVFWGIGAGLLLGAAHAVVLSVRVGAGRKEELALGPALLVGALTVSALLG
ncbi:prepilin peptidase [Kitasatospora sp. NPDC002551]|uniref:prepilin peptidase n=1 Tax=Kitasatospora sp. NPDC002551 TaxID=3154539 RepID=UPI003321AB2D